MVYQNVMEDALGRVVLRSLGNWKSTTLGAGCNIWCNIWWRPLSDTQRLV